MLQCFMHVVAAGWLSHVPITAAIGTIALLFWASFVVNPHLATVVATSGRHLSLIVKLGSEETVGLKCKSILGANV